MYYVIKNIITIRMFMPFYKIDTACLCLVSGYIPGVDWICSASSPYSDCTSYRHNNPVSRRS